MSTAIPPRRIRLAPAAAKARSNRSHALRRALERFGVELGDADVARIEATIRERVVSPECVPIRRDAHRNRALYAVRFAGAWLPVLYDEATASLLSVLPARALAHYRPDLDRGLAAAAAVGDGGADDPAPAPAKPALSPSDDGPPVGTVLGRIELPVSRRVSCRLNSDCVRPRDDPFASLPVVAALPADDDDGPTIADVETHLAANRARLAAVQAALVGLRGFSRKDPDRGRLVAEQTRLAAIVSRLKRARNEALTRRNVSPDGGESLDDPAELLRALHVAYRSMGGRLDWAIDEAERKAGNAARRYLELHTRCEVNMTASDGGGES